MSARSSLRGVLRVVEHHAFVYRRTWRGTVFSTFLNPILFLGALGVGLGSFVDDANPSGIEGVSYVMFLAPGILVATAMNTATFESTYPVMAGIRWLKTYVAMILSRMTFTSFFPIFSSRKRLALASLLRSSSRTIWVG